jgi:hypothetical protein
VAAAFQKRGLGQAVPTEEEIDEKTPASEDEIGLIRTASGQSGWVNARIFGKFTRGTEQEEKAGERELTIYCGRPRRV